MARNYAALPHEYLEEMETLSDEEFGRLCRALLKYSMSGEMPDLPGPERILIKRVSMQEKRFQDSYDASSKAHSSAGKAGADKRWCRKQSMADDSIAIHAMADDSIAIHAMADDSIAIHAMADDSKQWQKWETETNTETKTETKTNTLPDGSVSNKRAKRFTPPTLAEVSSYVAERHSPVDPQGFLDFYESNGWMVGKTPMKDWKAACRNAEKWDRWAKYAAKENPKTLGTHGTGDANWMKDYIAQREADKL